jgi:hypothetical protein
MHLSYCFAQDKFFSGVTHFCLSRLFGNELIPVREEAVSIEMPKSKKLQDEEEKT